MASDAAYVLGTPQSATVTIEDDDTVGGYSITGLALFNDNGIAIDLISSDATIHGTLSGSESSTSVDSIAVQFDHNADGAAEGFVNISGSNVTQASFDYDPLQFSPLVVGSVTLRARVIERAGEVIVAASAWSSFTFTFAESEFGAVDLYEGTTLLLDNMTVLDFGTTPRGFDVQRTYTVLNTGAGPLQVYPDVFLPDGFRVTSESNALPYDSTMSLDPWESATFTITFDASVAGTKFGTRLLLQRRRQ